MAEHASVVRIVTAFDALPDPFKVVAVNLLAERLPAAYSRAVAAMLNARFTEPPQPKSEE
jgi:hypothetical protein